MHITWTYIALVSRNHSQFYIVNAPSICYLYRVHITAIITLQWYTIVFLVIIIIIVSISPSLSSNACNSGPEGELNMCGGQDNSNYWLAFSYVWPSGDECMHGLSRRCDAPDTPKNKYLVGDKWKISSSLPSIMQLSYFHCPTHR